MTKLELAERLAEALNILNGIQGELDLKQQGYVHNLFASIPEQIREDADFANNGEIRVKQLIK